MTLDEVHEFSGDDIVGALRSIESLPEVARRIYVEVLIGTDWWFAYGDDRKHVPRLLHTVVNGRPFRLRGTDNVRRLQNRVPAVPARFMTGKGRW